MNNPNSKGNDLENAVEALERVILANSPSLKNNDFIIEKRKVIITEGVRHEVDIYVKIDLGNGYDSIFIFECKNWEDKVGKNEIIIFSEKIKALGAQKGFFVANSFSKYADGQAALDSRVHLLSVSDDEEVNIEIPDIHFVDKEPFHIDVLSLEKGNEDAKNRIEMDINTLTFTLDGKEQIFLDYLNKLANKLIDEKLSTEPTASFSEGLYKYKVDKDYLYPDDNITINDKIISKLVLTVTFEIRIIRPPISSKFNIETRGRVYAFAPVTFNSGGNVALSFIQSKKNV